MLLQIVKRGVRHFCELRWWDVDADLLQLEGVLFGRKTEIGARFGEHFLGYEIVVGGQLFLQLGIGRLIALHMVLLKELANAVDIGAAGGEILLDFALVRADKSGSVQFFPRGFFGEFDG